MSGAKRSTPLHCLRGQAEPSAIKLDRTTRRSNRRFERQLCRPKATPLAGPRQERPSEAPVKRKAPLRAGEHGIVEAVRQPGGAVPHDRSEGRRMNDDPQTPWAAINASFAEGIGAQHASRMRPVYISIQCAEAVFRLLSARGYG